MVMTFAALRDNLARVQDEIARVQSREGLRQPVRIVAVTKGHPADAVRAAAEVGLADIGENRVQEALRKQEELGTLAVRWHLIGHLQSNKAKYVPARFTLVHSVDSLRVAEALQRAVDRRDATGGPLEILLQVNVAGESTKSGCEPGALPELVERVGALPGLCVRGLMTMAPFVDDERVQRRVFAALRELRDRAVTLGHAMPELSMGMSGDYRAAVAEGATLVRLGTTLFGERGND